MSKPSEILERLIKIIEISDSVDEGSSLAPVCNLMKETKVCNTSYEDSAWRCATCPVSVSSLRVLGPLVNQLKVLELVDGD